MVESTELDTPLSEVVELMEKETDVPENASPEEILLTAVANEPHDANLAELLAGDTLSEFGGPELLTKLGRQVMDDFKSDEVGRKKWEEMAQRAMKALGVVDDDSPVPFCGATRIIHPGLGIGVLHFWARAFTEFWPSTGPVTIKIVGQPNPELLAQAERVREFINYHIQWSGVGFADEDSKAFYDLPYLGNAFKKVYIDSYGRPRSDYVHAFDLYAPGQTSSVMDAVRLTERIQYSRAEVLRLMSTGFYRDVELPDLGGEAKELDEIRQDAQGVTIETKTEDLAAPVKILEQHTVLSDFGDAPYPVPYIITILEENQEVLSIRRNFAEGDPDFRANIYYIHYRFPGAGFYGFGFYHLAAGLTDTEIKILRQIIDAGQFANMQGGFVSADAQITATDQSIGPGEWKTVKATSDELRRAFFPVDYKEPSQALVQMLAVIDGYQQRLFTTTDVPLGNINTEMPVGTANIMVEQANRVPNAILRGIHGAKCWEYKLLSDLIYQVLPEDATYPYPVNPPDALIKADFDSRIDVVPSVDPNQSSTTQRLAIAQTVMEMAVAANSTIDRREAERMMLEAMRVPNLQALLPERSGEAQPDPRMLMEMEKGKIEIARAQQKAQIEQASGMVKLQKLATKKEQDKLRGELRVDNDIQKMVQNREANQTSLGLDTLERISKIVSQASKGGSGGRDDSES